MLADKLRGMRHLFLTGRGSSLSAVGTGALIIKEAARVHAEGMSSAAFRHGPIEMLRPDMLIAVYQGRCPHPGPQSPPGAGPARQGRALL